MKPLLAAGLAIAVLVTGCSRPSERPGPTASQGPSPGARATVSPSVPLPSPPSIARPRQGATWQVQYAGTLALDGVDVIDVDGADTPAEVIATARSRGVYAICYLNAGAFEDWRDDADRFPSDILGQPLDGWPGEQWVDVRALAEVMPILGARLDECVHKGFQGVDPDNVDGWLHNTGFDLTREDSVRFVRALADAAHERGLAVGLKNATELLPDVLDDVDFAVNEECVDYGECEAYEPLLARGGAVFHIEYSTDAAGVCAATPTRFSTVLKDRDLGPERLTCPR